ncbi:MAG: hypothetical protein GY946_20955 [bacterium]|nr:hypothetical protein [bacterium]
MSSAPLLLPNISAEEGPGWRERIKQPAAASLVSLWRGLFDPPVPLAWLEDVSAAAWLNTEEAAEWAAAEGRVLFGAEPDIVARVHDKAFALAAAREAGLLPPLWDRVGVLEPAELRDPAAAWAILDQLLAAEPSAFGAFTLKPRHGSSGRGRVAGRVESLDRAALEGAFSRLADRGGALIEPWVARTADLSAQLLIEQGGGVLLLGTFEQCTSPAGLVRGHRGRVDSRGRSSSGSPHDEALREAAVTMALAASEAGYRGPCGVDAFVYRDSEGHEAFRPVVELNARFTVGQIALAEMRRAMPVLRERLGLAPGVLCGFHFGLAPPAPGWPSEHEGLVCTAAGDGPGLIAVREPESLPSAW